MEKSKAAAEGLGDLGHHRPPDVIVYTVGKVGSSSISSSLRAKGICCFDLHRLAPNRIQQLLVRSLSAADSTPVPNHLLESIAALNTLLHRRRSGIITKIVTSIREPISRNISAVFQNLPEALKGRPDEISRLVDEYSPLVPDNWFLRDFEPVTGLNVLGMAHDRERAAFRFQNERFDVLIVKTEAPDSEKSTVISDFVGNTIELRRTNESSNKWYSEIYSQCLQNARDIGNDFARRCLDLQYFRRFYSDLEIKNVSERYGL